MVGEILYVSEAAVRMMLRRTGIRRASRIETRLDDWQATITRAELKAETGPEGHGEWDSDCRLSQVPFDASVDPTTRAGPIWSEAVGRGDKAPLDL